MSTDRYLVALQAIIDRNELALEDDGFVENPEYLRGQLELIADVWPLMGVETQVRMEQVQLDIAALLGENQ